MMYYEFNVGDNTYKLRLSTRNIIQLEKKLGGNPLTLFYKGGEVAIPTLEGMSDVLHYSLQKFHHGISLKDVDDILDAYLEENTMNDLMEVVMNVYKVSGIISNDEDEEAEDTDRKN